MVEAGVGTDLVNSSAANFTLGANVENLTLHGRRRINGTGNTLANVITGNAGNNISQRRRRRRYHDRLGGNDIYVVDNAGDVSGGGWRRYGSGQRSAANFTLGANVENLTLTGAGNINGTGNTLANVLTGNAGNNIFDGGGGIDIMIGLGGDDHYVVDNAADKANEAGAGIDLVNSSVTFTLGANVENLTLTGVGNIGGTGNTLNNIIIGNTGANAVNGGVGNDTIHGLAGNDSLNGGAGIDIMNGGLGNDTYTVDNAADKANEAGAGTDIVNSSVTFTLGANVEKLTLTGTGPINGTGNTLNNTLTGNGGNNVLSGLTGLDVLTAGAGNDTLNGGLGSDTMTGGTGLDKFVFNAVLGSTNVDRIVDFRVVDDVIHLARAVFNKLPPGSTLAVDAFFKGAAAQDAEDRIVYNSANGALFYDADGSGAGAAVRFATLAPALLLTDADFLVV